MLKSKYLNKSPSNQQNTNLIHNNDRFHYKSNSFNDSLLNKYQNIFMQNNFKNNNDCLQTTNINNNVTVENKDNNIIESLKSKYLNKMSNFASTINEKLNRYPEVNSDFNSSQGRKFGSDKMLLKNSLTQKVNQILNQKSESVLDSFLEKYSDDNLNKGLEKRLTDVRLSPTKNDNTFIYELNSKTNL